MRKLKVDDGSQDGSIIVRDEDALCYIVKAAENGVSTIRTISKVLLAEWIEAVRVHPDLTEVQLQGLLAGKSKIDKLEYGYAATLKTLAEMSLELKPTIHIPRVYSDDFCEWFAANRGKGSDKTAKKYLSYFKTLTDVYQEPTHSYWHGLYKVMYGHDAERDVAEIGKLGEFDRLYGGILTALQEKKIAAGMNAVGAQKAITWFWQPEVKPHTCVTSALNAYRDFLKWRQVQGNDEWTSSADVLSVAIKLFQSARQNGRLVQGREVNGRLREYFDSFTEQSLGAITEDQIRELFTGTHFQSGAIDLRTMWSVTGQTYGGTIDPKGDAQKVQKIRDYLVRLKHDTALASTFWAGNDPDRPPGFGSSVVTELLMKFHPDEVLMYAKEGCATLKQLGLIEFDAPNADNGKRAAEFKLVQAAGTIILAKMRAMNIDKFIKSDGTGDGTAADYMTVNEFLCFVKENFQEIQKEVLKMNMTTVQPKPYDQTKGTKKVFGTSAEDRLMKRILASLTTKPFVILAGHSGTGKSRMVKKLAYMTCRDNDLHAGKDPLNYCMIEVKPNWHDSTELLGYFSSFGGDHYVKKQLIDFIMRAYAYPNVPFFVCLDEMNLAPVEQYFAEFLSALEDVHVDEDKAKAFTDRNAANVPTLGAAKEVVKYSSAPLVKPIDYKENTALLAPATTQANDWLETHGLTIPKNLFVVGTVNMDESTNQFSRKVLDRAFTIEMTDASFEDFGDANKDPEPDFVKEEDTDHSLIDALLMGGKKAGALTKKTDPTDANEPNGQLENMNALKGILDGTPFVVAYRFANEYALYEAALNKIDADDQGNVSDAQKKANAKQAFDDVVLAKLLPRIAGETPMVKGLYMGTKKKDGTEEKPGLLSLLPYEGFPKEGEGTDTASGLKMKAILSRPNQPYLTFWP